MEILAGSWFVYGTLFALFLWLWLDYKKKCYWKGKGIPYLTPIPFIGSSKTLRITLSSIHDLDREYHLKYGPVFGHFEGPVPILNVGDPDLIKTITVKDFHVFTNRAPVAGNDEIGKNMIFSATDEHWKRIRNAITPAFTSGKMRKMAYLINECVGSLLANLKEHAEQNKPVEIKKYTPYLTTRYVSSYYFRVLGTFTMDVISSTAFATRIDSYKYPDNPIAKNAQKLMSTDIRFIFPLTTAFPHFFDFLIYITKIPIIFDFSYFKGVTSKVLSERRSNPKKESRVDFLQLMVEAQQHSETNENNPKDQEYQIVHKLTEDEIFAQCIAFFVVGFDTTATTLTMALFLLAWHQEFQEKVQEEVDEALAKSNGEVNYDAVKSLPLVEALMCETLRMYPTVSGIDREASEDYTLPDTNIVLPKNGRVNIPIYGLHMNPKYFPEPDKFNPDRFMPGNKESINPYVYMPFGAGPRNCVAMRFAQMEVKLCLVHVLKKFSISPCSQTQKKPEFRPGQILLQPNDIFLNFKIRS